MSFKKYLGILLLFFAVPSFAQTVRFTASLSSTEVGTGQVFEVKFTLNTNADNFAPPSFNGLQVVSGPNTSSSMSYINGAMTSSTEYSYELVAGKEGTYSISSAAISVNGKTYRSNALQLRVVKGKIAPRASQNTSPQYQMDEDMEPAKPMKIGDNLFFRLEPSKTTVYVGQQINLRYKLYTRVPVVNLQPDKVPDLTGFWSEDIPNATQQANVNVETYKGREYNAALLKETVLFPDHAGSIKIDPASLTVMVRQTAPARSIIEQMMGGATEDVPHKVISPAINIQVKQLPLAGKPTSFDGAVGNFTLSASVDKKELNANQAINYIVKIAGTGNLKLLKNPVLNIPADFDKFDPKIADDIKVGTDGVSGSRTYTFVIVPRREGNFTIPAHEFAYFNPTSGKYVTVSSESIQLKVHKGDPSDNAVYSSGARSDVKQLNKDIQYIQTGAPDFINQDNDFFGSFSYFLLLLLAPVSLAVAYWYRTYLRKRNADPLAVRSRKAALMAQKHLSVAAKELSNSNSNVFYEAITKGMYGYLCDRFHLPPASLSRENIEDTLNQKAVDQPTIQEVLSILDTCEMARYSPVTQDSSTEFLDRTKKVIYELEKIF